MRQTDCEKQKPAVCYRVRQKALSHPPFSKWRLKCSKQGRGETQYQEINVFRNSTDCAVSIETSGDRAPFGYKNLRIFHYNSFHWIL